MFGKSSINIIDKLLLTLYFIEFKKSGNEFMLDLIGFSHSIKLISSISLNTLYKEGDDNDDDEDDEADKWGK